MFPPDTDIAKEWKDLARLEDQVRYLRSSLRLASGMKVVVADASGFALRWLQHRRCSRPQTLGFLLELRGFGHSAPGLKIPVSVVRFRPRALRSRGRLDAGPARSPGRLRARSIRTGRIPTLGRLLWQKPGVVVRWDAPR
jgi:hypothetical protein